MLVLTQRPGNHLSILLEDGRTITVHTLGVQGHQCRIGIEAPKTIAVHRDDAVMKVAKAQA